MALIHEALEARHRFHSQQLEIQENARQAAEERERTKRDEEEATRQGRKLGESVVRLLETHGARIPQNALGTTTRADRIYTAVGTWFLLPVALRMGMTNLEFVDKTVLTAGIEVTEGEPPVNITLQCDTALPRRSPKLEVFVEDLDDHFMLASEVGGIPQIVPNRYGEKPTRNATLDDVTRYADVVRMVQQRYPLTSLPSR